MTRRTLEIAAFCAALLIAALAIHAWLSSRDEQQRLQSTLATQKQVLDAADARERTRDATLNDALAKIEKLKRATQTPQQILRDLPNYLPLPQPITLAPSANNTNAQQGTALPEKSASARTAQPAPSQQPPGTQPLPTAPSRSSPATQPTQPAIASSKCPPPI
jgi:type II secretory pathway pseudopilin PulG